MASLQFYMLVPLPAPRGLESFPKQRSLRTGDASGVKVAGLHVLRLACEGVHPDEQSYEVGFMLETAQLR